MGRPALGLERSQADQAPAVIGFQRQQVEDGFQTGCFIAADSTANLGGFPGSQDLFCRLYS